MKMMECKECGVSFNLFSQEKKKAGGLIFNCADCAEEQHIKYAGVQSADGKQSQATILKFKSNEDKEAYLKFWRNNSGQNVGKKCQLGAHLSTTPAINFETITEFAPTNHKGKA